MKRMFLLAGACGMLSCLAAEPRNVPELMTTAKGEKVASVEQWEKVRAPELLATFTREVYGRRVVERPPQLSFERAEPDEVMMDGKALRKRIRVNYGGKYGKGTFVFTAFIPRQARPAPAFVLICNRKAADNIDPTRARKSASSSAATRPSPSGTATSPRTGTRVTAKASSPASRRPARARARTSGARSRPGPGARAA